MEVSNLPREQEKKALMKDGNLNQEIGKLQRGELGFPLATHRKRIVRRCILDPGEGWKMLIEKFLEVKESIFFERIKDG